MSFHSAKFQSALVFGADGLWYCAVYSQVPFDLNSIEIWKIPFVLYINTPFFPLSPLLFAILLLSIHRFLNLFSPFFSYLFAEFRKLCFAHLKRLAKFPKRAFGLVLCIRRLARACKEIDLERLNSLPFLFEYLFAAREL
jgi:hypothetical protein